MSDPLRVGLVGYGFGGSTFHAPLFGATPGLQLVAIATSDPARVEKASARWPSGAGRAAPRRVLDDAAAAGPRCRLHAAREHVPIARAALAAGCHVVVDKPFATCAARGARAGGGCGGDRPPRHPVPEPALGRRLPHAPAAVGALARSATFTASSRAMSAGDRRHPSRAGWLPGPPSVAKDCSWT